MKETKQYVGDNITAALFSKGNCDILKGVAILLMYFHHLFAFPDRIIYPNHYIPISGLYDIEYFIAEFSKICVPIFLFLSGIGFSFQGNKKVSYYLNKVIDFYQSYFIVFAIFIPMGFVLFGNVNNLNFQITSVLSNLTMLSSTYNGEWWYAGVYVLCVILTPLLKRLGGNLSAIISSTLLCLYFTLHFLSISIPPIVNNFLLWQCIFVFGLFFSKILSNFESHAIFSHIKTHATLLMIFSSLVALILYQYLKVYLLITFTPLFCLLACIVLNGYDNKFIFCFDWLGKRTIFMWLTHSFFCYYYFQNVVFYPEYSLLIFLNLILLTLPCCFLLEKLLMLVNKSKANYFQSTPKAN
jgi:hypothetical protein